MSLDGIPARDSRCGPGNLAAHSPRGHLVRLGLKREFWPPHGWSVRLQGRVGAARDRPRDALGGTVPSLTRGVRSPIDPGAATGAKRPFSAPFRPLLGGALRTPGGPARAPSCLGRAARVSGRPPLRRGCGRRPVAGRWPAAHGGARPERSEKGAVSVTHGSAAGWGGARRPGGPPQAPGRRAGRLGWGYGAVWRHGAPKQLRDLTKHLYLKMHF